MCIRVGSNTDTSTRCFGHGMDSTILRLKLASMQQRQQAMQLSRTPDLRGGPETGQLQLLRQFFFLAEASPEHGPKMPRGRILLHKLIHGYSTGFFRLEEAAVPALLYPAWPWAFAVARALDFAARRSMALDSFSPGLLRPADPSGHQPVGSCSGMNPFRTSASALASAPCRLGLQAPLSNFRANPSFE